MNTVREKCQCHTKIGHTCQIICGDSSCSSDCERYYEGMENINDSNKKIKNSSWSIEYIILLIISIILLFNVIMYIINNRKYIEYIKW